LQNKKEMRNLAQERITDVPYVEIPEDTTEDLKCAESVLGSLLTKVSYPE